LGEEVDYCERLRMQHEGLQCGTVGHHLPPARSSDGALEIPPVGAGSVVVRGLGPCPELSLRTHAKWLCLTLYLALEG